MGHMRYDSYIFWVGFGTWLTLPPLSNTHMHHTHTHTHTHIHTHTHTHTKVKETNMAQYCSCAGQFTETLPFDSFIEQMLTFKNIARCVKLCVLLPHKDNEVQDLVCD